MRKSSFGKRRKIRYKAPIAILALIAYAGVFFVYAAPILNSLKSVPMYALINIIWATMQIIPMTLLLLYVLMLYKKRKSTIIVPIIFACHVVAALIEIFLPIIFYGYTITYINLIDSLIVIISFTLATISALKGMSNKVLIIIPIAYSLLSGAFSLIGGISSFFGWDYYLYEYLLPNLSAIAFNVALLLFGLKNRIPAVLSKSAERDKIRAMITNPYKYLRILNDEYELGIISERAYQARRAEFVDSL